MTASITNYAATDTEDFATSLVVPMPAGWDFPAGDIHIHRQLRSAPGAADVALDFNSRDGSARIAAQDAAARTITLAFFRAAPAALGLAGVYFHDTLLSRFGQTVRVDSGTCQFSAGVTIDGGA